MSTERNPQARQMGDSSMARTLAFQAEAIWPQEVALFERYGLHGPIRILDLGCGTGEATRRLARHYPAAELLGVDILESNLAVARSHDAGVDRIHYEQGDAFELGCADAAFDLVVCRHLSNAVPDFAQVIDEITRVLKPGGRLHLLAEDYGMLRFPHRAPGGFDPDRFWGVEVLGYLESIGCDGRFGRHAPAVLAERGYVDVSMAYVVVDTFRVARETFAGILEAWRDGYAKTLSEARGIALPQVHAGFEAMIASIRSPPHYVVWQVPVAAARKPGG